MHYVANLIQFPAKTTDPYRDEYGFPFSSSGPSKTLLYPNPGMNIHTWLTAWLVTHPVHSKELIRILSDILVQIDKFTFSGPLLIEWMHPHCSPILHPSPQQIHAKPPPPPPVATKKQRHFDGYLFINYILNNSHFTLHFGQEQMSSAVLLLFAAQVHVT